MWFLTKAMSKFLKENHDLVHNLADPASPYYRDLEICPLVKNQWNCHFRKATILDIAYNAKDYFRYDWWNDVCFRFMFFWRTLTHD